MTQILLTIYAKRSHRWFCYLERLCRMWGRSWM